MIRWFGTPLRDTARGNGALLPGIGLHDFL
jgi:hypothetical protein